MPVPTHGPSRKKSLCRSSRCGDCGQDDLYSECICGGRALFDDFGGRRPKHECNENYTGTEERRTYVYAIR